MMQALCLCRSDEAVVAFPELGLVARRLSDKGDGAMPRLRQPLHGNGCCARIVGPDLHLLVERGGPARHIAPLQQRGMEFPCRRVDRGTDDDDPVGLTAFDIVVIELRRIALERNQRVETSRRRLCTYRAQQLVMEGVDRARCSACPPDDDNRERPGTPSAQAGGMFVHAVIEFLRRSDDAAARGLCNAVAAGQSAADGRLAHTSRLGDIDRRHPPRLLALRSHAAMDRARTPGEQVERSGE